MMYFSIIHWRFNMKYKKIKKLITITLSCFCLFLNSSLKVNAEIDYNAEAEARKLLPIQSNNIQEWPQGPALGAQSAILMELETGTILYSKNMELCSYYFGSDRNWNVSHSRI